MTVLVTGGRGFLGSPLLAELRRRRPGGRVSALGRTPAPGSLACDLRDPSAARRAVLRLRPDVIFHLAGTTASSRPEELWDAHVRTTANLLEAVLRLPRPGAVRIVVAGSSAEYGAAAGPRPIGEDAATLPVTPYGSTKLSETLLSLSYRHQGLDVSVARVFNAIGPGTPDNLALGAFARQLALIEKGLQRPELRVGDLAPRRDLLDVRDAARALADIAQRAPAEIYNVCSGRSVSIGEALRRLIALSGLEIAVTADPARRRSADIPRIVGSHRRLTAATGWRPRIPLETSLRDVLDWHRRR